MVDDADGSSLAVELMSRGAREQLFLRMRLALVDYYRRREIEMPLVLDDVLVNFDDERSREPPRSSAILPRQGISSWCSSAMNG